VENWGFAPLNPSHPFGGIHRGATENLARPSAATNRIGWSWRFRRRKICAPQTNFFTFAVQGILNLGLVFDLFSGRETLDLAIGII